MMAKMSLSLSPCKAKASPGLGLQSKDLKKTKTGTVGPSSFDSGPRSRLGL